LQNYSPFLVRLLDFDLFTDLLDQASTKSGLYLFQATKGNSALDFCRFASQAEFQVPKSWKSWHAFVRRWIPHEFLESRPTSLASANALIPTPKGAQVLNQLYGWGKKSALLQMLDDPYFEELRV
jgi:hypothetical protein